MDSSNYVWGHVVNTNRLQANTYRCESKQQTWRDMNYPWTKKETNIIIIATKPRKMISYHHIADGISNRWEIWQIPLRIWENHLYNTLKVCSHRELHMLIFTIKILHIILFARTVLVFQVKVEEDKTRSQEKSFRLGLQCSHRNIKWSIHVHFTCMESTWTPNTYYQVPSFSTYRTHVITVAGGKISSIS